MVSSLLVFNLFFFFFFYFTFRIYHGSLLPQRKQKTHNKKNENRSKESIRSILWYCYSDNHLPSKWKINIIWKFDDVYMYIFDDFKKENKFTFGRYLTLIRCFILLSSHAHIFHLNEIRLLNIIIVVLAVYNIK